MAEENPNPLRIDADAINRYVADAVLKSAIGKSLQESIDRVLASAKPDFYGKSPVDDVIRRHVADMVLAILTRDYADKLRERIAAGLAEKMTDEFIGKLCDAALSRLERG